MVALGCLNIAVTACGAGPETSRDTTTSPAPVVHGLTLEDRTGLVRAWEFAEDVDSWGDVPDDFEWGIRQIDARTLEVGWWALGCDDDPRLVIDSGVIELTLDGSLDDRPDPEIGCALMGVWREIRMIFTDEVDIESFNLSVIEPPT